MNKTKRMSFFAGWSAAFSQWLYLPHPSSSEAPPSPNIDSTTAPLTDNLHGLVITIEPEVEDTLAVCFENLSNRDMVLAKPSLYNFPVSWHIDSPEGVVEYVGPKIKHRLRKYTLHTKEKKKWVVFHPLDPSDGTVLWPLHPGCPYSVQAEYIHPTDPPRTSRSNIIHYQPMCLRKHL